MSDTTNPVSSTEKERQEVLHRIWLAQAKALLAALENPEKAQAATLNVARQFLTDNGITNDSLKDARRHAHDGLEAALRAMDEAGLDELGSDLPPADPE